MNALGAVQSAYVKVLDFKGGVPDNTTQHVVATVRDDETASAVNDHAKGTVEGGGGGKTVNAAWRSSYTGNESQGIRHVVRPLPRSYINMVSTRIQADTRTVGTTHNETLHTYLKYMQSPTSMPASSLTIPAYKGCRPHVRAWRDADNINTVT